jgi:fatty acid desaturase
MRTARRFPWPLASLPQLEIGCFVAACVALEEHPFMALALLLVAALALSLAVHVFFHECIHFSTGRPLPRAFTWLASTAMGLPFDGYRIHHYNHHRHDNGAADFSSTWRFDGSAREPRAAWSYALSWPRQSIAAGMYVRKHAREPSESNWTAEIATRMPAQRWVLLIVLAALALASWPYAIMYVALVYLGWTAVALHNYGQHPPCSPAGGDATTWDQPLYNRLVFNNGLHWEHHARPDLAWNELTADGRSPRIRLPHLLQPLAPQLRPEVTHD